MQSREYIETLDGFVECYIERMTRCFALVMILGLFQISCSHSQVGFVEGPTRVLARIDYDTPSWAKDADRHVEIRLKKASLQDKCNSHLPKLHYLPFRSGLFIVTGSRIRSRLAASSSPLSSTTWRRVFPVL